MPPPTPERVLLIRPSALGDVCKTVPALVSLRRAYPSATIDWLVQSAFVPAVASHPALSGVVAFDRAALGDFWRSRDAARAVRAFLASLRNGRYDLVFDLQGLLRSGAFAWATRAPRRVGYANAMEFGWLGVNVRHRVPWEMHSVDRALALLRAEGVPTVTDMRLYSAEADRAALHPALRGARCALLAPTSRWLGKRWPADRFADLAAGLLAERLVDAVAFVGMERERGQCGPLLALAERDRRVVDLMGRTTVGGLMAAVEAAALVVGNDSAVLHMAVGFGRPLVGLYGPTRVDRVGPYGREADVLQRAAPGEDARHKDEAHGVALMKRIPTAEVLEWCAARLRGAPRERPQPTGGPTVR